MKLELSFSAALLSALLIYSCKSQSAQTDDFDGIIIEAPLLNETPTDKPVFSDYIESIDTIRLDDSVLESYIGYSMNIKCASDYIFIQYNSGVYLFDYQGKYVRRINKIGRGHGEYLSMKCYDIQEERKIVSIYDLQTASIYEYSFNGDFVKKIPISQYICSFAALSNGHYLLFNYEDVAIKGLFEIDNDGNVIRTLFEIPAYFKHVYHEEPFLIHLNNDVISCRGLEDSNIIYHFENDSLRPAFKINTDIVMPREVMEMSKLWDNMDREYSKILFCETERFMSVTLFNMDVWVTVFYDNKKNHLYRLHMSEYLKDNSLNDLFPYAHHTYNGRLADVIDYEDIEKDETLRKKFPDMTMESNPVLVIYNIK